MKNTKILTSKPEVESLAQRLMQEKSVAVDLEMDALHNYQEKICLAQISTPDETVIIDPLAEADLAPLAPFFAAGGVGKIFHAADYDLRSLKRDYGFAVDNLFDTMIAAQFCGEEKIGLADLLNKYFDVELDKKYQRADWSQRPLKKEMIDYAAEDTRHLHRLASMLEKRLKELGRLPWLEEECRLLEAVEFDRNSGPLCLRFKGAGRLERPQLAVLEELLQWRDREARRRNRPHFKVLGNKPILAMTRSVPTTRAQLLAIEGLNDRLVDRYGKKLLDCLEKGANCDEKEWPHFPRPARSKRDPEAERILAKLKKWRLAKAAELQIDPGVLINNSQLEAAARTRPNNTGELQQVRDMRCWQVDAFGEELLAQLA